jgi:zinc protease
MASDALVFSGRGSSGNLRELVEAEARWATRLSFSGPSFDLQKKYVRRIHASWGRSPRARARQALLAGLFPGHPYGAATTAEAIDALSSRQASAWVKGAVRPERATVLVVSDVAPSPEGWKWIEKGFGGWDRAGAGPVPPAPLASEPAARSVTLIERKGASQALVAVGFRLPPLAARDAPAHDALRWLLESRLNQRLRVEEGVSYGVSTSLVEHRQGAALLVAAAVDAEAAPRALRTVLRAAADLAKEPLHGASAARARWMVARAFATRFDTVDDVADALETIALHFLPPDHFDRLPASIASLDPARIQAAALTLSVGREVVVVSGDRSVSAALAAAGVPAELRAEPAE